MKIGRSLTGRHIIQILKPIGAMSRPLTHRENRRRRRRRSTHHRDYCMLRLRRNRVSCSKFPTSTDLQVYIYVKPI
jgi:hypothetical protein